MNQVQSLDSVPRIYDTGDVDLAGSLRDHLDIDAALGEGGEHEPCNTDHIAHLLPDEGEDGHVMMYRYL